MRSSESGAPGRRVKTDRSAVFAVGAQFWINGMAYAAIVPRLPDIRDRLSIGVAALGTVLTIAALGGLLGSAVSGSIIARYGTKRCIVGGTIATVLILPFVGVADTPLALIVVIGLLAMLDVVIDISMNLQGSWLSARRSTPIMNRLHGLWSLGTVIGGLIAVRAAGAGVSLATHLLVIAALLAGTLFVSGRYLLASDDQQPDEPSQGDVARQAPARTTAPTTRSIGIVLGLLGAAAVTMELTTSDWAAFRLADDLGAEPGRVGLGFVAFTSGMVIGRFAGDTIQAAIGTRALVRAASLVAAAGLALATAVPYQRFTESTEVAIAVSVLGFFVAALGVSVVFPHFYDAAAKAPGRPGAGLAALTAGTRVASVLSPIIVGSLAATNLSVGTAMALITIPPCLATILLSPRVNA